MSLTKQDLTGIRDVVLDALDVAVNPRLDLLETRMDGLETKVDGLETKVDGLELKVDGIDTKVGGLELKVDGVEFRLGGIENEQRRMREWLEKIDSRLLGIESDIKETYDTIVALEQKSNQRPLAAQEKRELERQIAALFEWAKQVSKQTGIPLPKL